MYASEKSRSGLWCAILHEVCKNAGLRVAIHVSREAHAAHGAAQVAHPPHADGQEHRVDAAHAAHGLLAAHVGLALAMRHGGGGVEAAGVSHGGAQQL
eukprot:scaffold3747_cov240-Pinguiococcus_pyrenoidosus.AAC.6